MVGTTSNDDRRPESPGRGSVPRDRPIRADRYARRCAAGEPDRSGRGEGARGRRRRLARSRASASDPVNAEGFASMLARRVHDGLAGASGSRHSRSKRLEAWTRLLVSRRVDDAVPFTSPEIDAEFGRRRTRAARTPASAASDAGSARDGWPRRLSARHGDAWKVRSRPIESRRARP